MRSVTRAQSDKLTVKLKNNLAKNKAPVAKLKSKVVKVVTRKGASKSSGSSEASTAQGSSPLRDEATLPIPQNIDWSSLMHDWGEFMQSHKAPLSNSNHTYMPLPILIPQQSSQKSSSTFSSMMERRTPSPVVDDQTHLVGASEHVDVGNVSSSHQHFVRCPQVSSVDLGPNVPQQDVGPDVESLQVDMEIDLEDAPPPPPAGRPAIVVAESAPQSALDLVSARSSGGKQHKVLLARHFPINIRRQIWADIYIDLALMLEKDHFAEQPLQFVNKNGKVTLSTAPSSVKIETWALWNKAFRMFTEIYCLKYPNKCMELLQYSGLLNNLAGKFPFSQVYMYDKEFCLELQQLPSTPWNVIDTQLWSQCLHGINTMGSFRQQQQQPNTQQHKKATKVDWPF